MVSRNRDKTTKNAKAATLNYQTSSSRKKSIEPLAATNFEVLGYDYSRELILTRIYEKL